MSTSNKLGEETIKYTRYQNISYGHMSTRFMKELLRNPGKYGVDSLINMIKLMSRYGLTIPTRVGSLGLSSYELRSPWYADSNPESFRISPFDLALKSHIPPCLLGLMLDQYDSLGLKLTDRYAECPESLVKLAEKRGEVIWVECCTMDQLIWNLHADLHHDPSEQEASYPREVADMFAQKLNIMIKREMIDTSEQSLLQSILEALYYIADISLAIGGLDERHSRNSWMILCNAVRPYFTNPNLASRLPFGVPNPNLRRIHRFAIKTNWNPWMTWYLREDAIKRHNALRESGMLPLSGYDSLVRDNEDLYYHHFFEPYLDEAQIPPWYTVDMDECKVPLTGAAGPKASHPIHGLRVLRYIMTDQQRRRDTPTASASAAAAAAAADSIISYTETPAAAPAQTLAQTLAHAPSSPAPQAELIPAEDPEGNFDNDRYEIDSAIGSDAGSFMYPDSVTASILEYRTIQGRTYHSDRHASEYVMPNDEQQLQSIDITHHYLTILLDDNLFLAPISPHVQKVLDVGTGSGVWAMQVPPPVPAAQVIGSDLSPCQPEWVPPNVHFEIADATLTWPWKDNYFDFTHIRYLFGAVPDWPALFQEAYRCCAPGGWVQSCEADVHFYSDDGTADSEPAFRTWADLYEKGGVATGRTFFPQQEALQERSITEAGFTDVRIIDYKIPVGGWANNRKLSELGEYVKLTLDNDLEGYTLYLWLNVLNWPREEYTQFIAEMRKAISNRRVHSYMMVRYVYARKP
ncbi:hypothetical protein F53441_13875 [Fusarium austroafricanum]|uniref:Methyltransferase domain-containing protein n=1 Tax=Fusarium austroafricanum TaxID=2364996 RepID=A0A8H4JK74_9HYPO|nr:hypothetical protein F53441_13875 [Fusarium austroafricanum]